MQISGEKADIINCYIVFAFLSQTHLSSVYIKNKMIGLSSLVLFKGVVFPTLQHQSLTVKGASGYFPRILCGIHVRPDPPHCVNNSCSLLPYMKG